MIAIQEGVYDTFLHLIWVVLPCSFNIKTVSNRNFLVRHAVISPLNYFLTVLKLFEERILRDSSVTTETFVIVIALK